MTDSTAGAAGFEPATSTFTDRSSLFLGGFIICRFFADDLLGGAATFQLRNEILHLGAENDGAARHIDCRQSAPADQVNNGLLRYASDSCLRLLARLVKICRKTLSEAMRPPKPGRRVFNAGIIASRLPERCTAARSRVLRFPWRRPN
jgi:hypothetical protein